MIDNRKEFKQHIHKDFLEELFLEPDCVFFYVEANEDVLNNPLQWVLKLEELLAFTSLNDILERVERKSEKCEIIGYEEYYKSLQYEILSFPNRIKWDIPIHLENSIVSVSIRLKYIADASIFIGYYTIHADGEQALLIANSYKDTLTGLFNRNTLNIHLSKLHADQTIFGVLLDVDHFKSINDTYGHETGDMVLAKIGKMFIDISNEQVIFYRIGGDEFFIQVHASREELAAFLTMVEDKMHEIVVNGQPITCSMGAALYNDSCSSPEALLKLCDSAMYKAKSLGRNQFCIL